MKTWTEAIEKSPMSPFISTLFNILGAPISFFSTLKDYEDNYQQKNLFKKSPFWSLPLPNLDAIFSSSEPKERLYYLIFNFNKKNSPFDLLIFYFVKLGISTSFCVKKWYFHCSREKWLNEVINRSSFFPVVSGNIISSHKRMWKCHFHYKRKKFKSLRKERCIPIRFLIYYLVKSAFIPAWIFHLFLFYDIRWLI